MPLYNSIAFWKWLYSSGYQPLPDSQLEALKTSFEYTHKQVTSEYESERFTWDYKSLLIPLPINDVFSICSLIQLNDDTTFEENIYLKKEDKYYGLGWVDAHNHKLIFSFEEFYQLLGYLKRTLSKTEDYAAYVLFLARFVTLITEKQATQLMQDAIACYKIVMATDTVIEVVIEKSSLYGTKLPASDICIKTKRISTPNHPLCFTINEGLSWTKDAENNYTLKGFAAHSMRNEHFKNGRNAPIDLYDVNTNLDVYRFPETLWKELLSSTTLV